MTWGRCWHMLGQECSSVGLSFFCEFVEIWEQPSSSNALYLPWDCPSCNKYLGLGRNYKVGLFKEKNKSLVQKIKFLFLFLLSWVSIHWAQNIMHMIRSRRNKSMEHLYLVQTTMTERWWRSTTGYSQMMGKMKGTLGTKLQMMRKMKKQHWVPKPRKCL